MTKYRLATIRLGVYSPWIYQFIKMVGVVWSVFRFIKKTNDVMAVKLSKYLLLLVIPGYACNMDVVDIVPPVKDNNVSIEAEHFLTNPETSDLYFEFRELVGRDGSMVKIENPGLRDLSKNNYSILLVNKPKVNNRAGQTTLEISGPSCISIGDSGSKFLSRREGFSINFELSLGNPKSARQPTKKVSICGNLDNDENNGLQIHFKQADSISNSGQLVIQYMNNIWESTPLVSPTGPNEKSSFDIHFDFENDKFLVFENGNEVKGSWLNGDISSINPSDYQCNAELFVGSVNHRGMSEFNQNVLHLSYFAITRLQNDNHAAIREYLTSRKPVFELISVVKDPRYLLSPHDIEVIGNKAYVSGKGHDVSATMTGSFGVIDLSDPSHISVIGGYHKQGDQKDGETVMVLSENRVLHFFKHAVHLFDVSNPSNVAIIKTEPSSKGVINGAVQVGKYIFAANKGGTIDVFDISEIDNFRLVGSYATNGDLSNIGPHDVDVTTDGEHIVIVSRPNSTQYFAIYKVIEQGQLIPIEEWRCLSKLSNKELKDANRCRVVDGTNTVIVSSGLYFATIDITDKANPVLNGAFANSTFSSGLTEFTPNFAIATWQVGLRLFNIADPVKIVEEAGYYDDETFKQGNASFHDLAVFKNDGNYFVIVTCQSSNEIALFKINKDFSSN